MHYKSSLKSKSILANCFVLISKKKYTTTTFSLSGVLVVAGFAVPGWEDVADGAEIAGTAGRASLEVIDGAFGVGGCDTWGAAGTVGGGTIPEMIIQWDNWHIF